MIKRTISIFLLVLAAAGCKNDEDTLPTSSLRPVITSMSPATAVRGQQNVHGIITGANFGGVVAVELGSSIRVESSTVTSATEIQVVFSVNPDAQPGPVTVRVATAGGIGSNAGIFSIGDNQPPKAQFAFDPANPGVNVTITFNASASNDPDGHISTYSWDFGDGSSADGKVVTHKFASAGAFDVKLKVLDNQSAEGTTSGRVEINNFRPPVAHYNVNPTSGTSLTVFTFDGSSSTDGDGKIVRYLWDLGNGVEVEGKKITHQFHDPNSYKVKLTVFDNHDQNGYVEKFLKVKGVPPVAQFTASPETAAPGVPIVFNGSGSNDPDGVIRRYSWNFGDGSGAEGATVTHAYAYEGTFRVALTVVDEDDRRSTGTRDLRIAHVGGGDDDDDDDDDDGGVPGGSCQINGWFDNPFKVVGVSGFTITGDRRFVNCPGRCGEIRRKAVGIREFVGDLVKISGPNMTFNPHTLPTSTRPEIGETLYLVWRACGG